jgi:hypothetical protein
MKQRENEKQNEGGWEKPDNLRSISSQTISFGGEKLREKRK